MTLPAKWIDTLSPTEQVVAKISGRVYRRIEMWGACYHLTFFLNEYFRQEKGIKTEAVVGWVNDGEDDLLASHAWLELNGKKTDIAIARPQYYENSIGPLIILDKIIQRDEITYTYHKERSHVGITDSEFENRHQELGRIAKDEKLIRVYLNNAPPDATYEAWARIIS